MKYDVDRGRDKFRAKNRVIVEALTGIFCTVSASLVMHVSRRVFDRRIDLKWFRVLQIEFTRSKLEKTDFWVKNRPFLAVF